MTTYPLATLAPTVNSAGITAPSLADIIASLQASYQSIYGTDVVLDPSTQDGQWIGIQGQVIYDSNQAIIAAYNQASPATAVGTGLSSVVKINGMTRKVASYSLVTLTIVGQVGTQINNGQVGDNQNLNTVWALPSTVTIPSGGSISVTATCTTLGAVTAAPNTLTVIKTPTAGWQTANNAAAASVGTPVEADSALRQRQSLSTAAPAKTVFDAVVGNVLALSTVTAVGGYVNNTGTTDTNGVPPYAWALVVTGGVAQSIVNAIGAGKTQGPPTYGTTSGTYTSPLGVPETINYTVTAQQRIIVVLTIKALAGYTATIGAEIQASIAAYINSLGLTLGSTGTVIHISRMYGAALLDWVGYQPASPNDRNTFEVQYGTLRMAIFGNSLSTADILLAYNQQATCQVSDVTLTVT